VLRPEAIEIDRSATPRPHGFAGVVTAVRHRGPTVDLTICLETGEQLRVLKTLPGYHDVRAGERVWLWWDEREGVLLPAGSP
jgi:hypothetical protein